MKRIARFAVWTAALSAVAGMLIPAAETRRMSGEFVWHSENGGALEAEFTPAGERHWDVAFRFDWAGQKRVFSGTAEGSLDGGELSGTVLDESKARTFTFRGSFEGSTFRGKHAEIADGERHDTGTLTLRRPS